MKRVAGKLAKADIAVAALPATNLYLQGRSAGTPDRRGITRIQELRDAGVTVTIGADNVRDAFCPIGNHNPLTTLSLAVLGAHLDPPFEDHLDLITTSASKALGLAPTTVDGAVPGDLLVFDATSLSDLIARQPGARRLSEMLQGELI